MTSRHSFALFSLHTLNLNVRLEPLESLFLGLQFGHKNDLERNPDERVIPVQSFDICAENRYARAGIPPLERGLRDSSLKNGILRSFSILSFPSLVSSSPRSETLRNPSPKTLSSSNLSNNPPWVLYQGWRLRKDQCFKPIGTWICEGFSSSLLFC